MLNLCAASVNLEGVLTLELYENGPIETCIVEYLLPRSSVNHVQPDPSNTIPSSCMLRGRQCTVYGQVTALDIASTFTDPTIKQLIVASGGQTFGDLVGQPKCS